MVKNYYYIARTKDGQNLANEINYITNPGSVEGVYSIAILSNTPNQNLTLSCVFIYDENGMMKKAISYLIKLRGVKGDERDEETENLVNVYTKLNKHVPQIKQWKKWADLNKTCPICRTDI